MREFHALSDIVALWRSAAECGRALGVRATTMRKYATGERPIPVEIIEKLVIEARLRPGGAGVSHELVVRLAAAAARRRRKTDERDAA